MERYTDQYKVDVPVGQLGQWSIRRFTVSAEAAKFEELRAAISSSRGRGVPEGTYTGLYHTQRGVVMSDTPDEISDHLGFIRSAHGHVLIAGLGLGMVTRACLLTPEVQSVTVIELDADVITLVSTWLSQVAERAGKVLTIVHADALIWKPAKGQRFHTAWYDIWDHLCGDNLETMKTLHRRYGKRCDEQGSWGRDLIEARERREAKERRK